jgi:hypothetical protein
MALNICFLILNTQNEVYFVKVGEFEILAAVTMDSTVFWDVTPCNPLEIHRRFVGSKDKPSRELAGSALLASCFWLDLLFYPEDGRSTFLRYFVTLVPHYTASHPRYCWLLARVIL